MSSSRSRCAVVAGGIAVAPLDRVQWGVGPPRLSLQTPRKPSVMVQRGPVRPNRPARVRAQGHESAGAPIRPLRASGRALALRLRGSHAPLGQRDPSLGDALHTDGALCLAVAARPRIRDPSCQRRSRGRGRRAAVAQASAATGERDHACACRARRMSVPRACWTRNGFLHKKLDKKALSSPCEACSYRKSLGSWALGEQFVATFRDAFAQQS